MTPLSQDVFQTIADWLIGRTADIEKFAETRLSFEEWCNWEAFAACRRNASWNVSAKPRYSHHVADSALLGDLFVTDGSRATVVEIGIAHDGTGSKWLTKFEADFEKLRPLACARLETLHIILLASFGDHIDSESIWKNWLAKISFWQKDTGLLRSSRFIGGGQLLMKGWLTVPDPVAFP